MPKITIKGISEETLSLLRKKAALNQKSLNQEISELLIRHAHVKKIDVNSLLKSIDKARPSFTGKLSTSLIQSTIRKGKKWLLKMLLLLPDD